jgi:hypothetical protein
LGTGWTEVFFFKSTLLGIFDFFRFDVLSLPYAKSGEKGVMASILDIMLEEAEAESRRIESEVCHHFLTLPSAIKFTFFSRRALF